MQNTFLKPDHVETFRQYFIFACFRVRCFCGQKVISELLIADATRRGFVDGRCLRLPTIIVRPGRCVIRSSVPEH